MFLFQNILDNVRRRIALAINPDEPTSSNSLTIKNSEALAQSVALSTFDGRFIEKAPSSFTSEPRTSTQTFGNIDPHQSHIYPYLPMPLPPPSQFPPGPLPYHLPHSMLYPHYPFPMSYPPPLQNPVPADVLHTQSQSTLPIGTTLQNVPVVDKPPVPGSDEQAAAAPIVLSSDPQTSFVHAHRERLEPRFPLVGSYVNDDTQYIRYEDLVGGGWNGWPQGNFAMDITHEQFMKTNRLAVHWSTKTTTGRQVRGSSKSSTDITLGVQSTRSCFGIIQCRNPDCAIMIRPHTQGLKKINKQLQSQCRCGGELFHLPCPNRSKTIRWGGGVRYMNGIDDHNHPTHAQLHVDPHEMKEFSDLVKGNPKAAPAALISGNTVDGKSSTEISDVLIHAGRVGRYRSEILGITQPKGGDDFIASFMEFQQQNPGFIVSSTMLGGVAVISAQTPFMASRLHDETLKVDGPFNGVVSDAAHGWWRVRNSLLIVTSVFCEILQSWIPSLISYSNGATATHYEYHFLALMEAIARTTLEQGKQLVDELFAVVIDFSEAERLGFIQAFIRFWNKHNSTRSEQDLRQKAETLLRGCRQHFRSSITRVKRITAIVPVEKQGEFEKLAVKLLDAEDQESFQKIASSIQEDYPKLRPWLNWWLRNEHASMLFQSQRLMDPIIWNSLPDSTNAEEAMHFSLYSQQGKNHDFLSGFAALKKVATTFELKYNAERIGQPTHWGKPALENRNALKRRIGRTKLSRTKEKIQIKHKHYFNDGRPKDDHRLLQVGLKHKAQNRNKRRRQDIHRITHHKARAQQKVEHADVLDHIFEDWNGIAHSNSSKQSSPPPSNIKQTSAAPVHTSTINHDAESLKFGSFAQNSSDFMKRWLNVSTPSKAATITQAPTGMIPKSPVVQQLRRDAVSSVTMAIGVSMPATPPPAAPQADPLAMYSYGSLVDDVPRDFKLAYINGHPILVVSKQLNTLQGYKWYHSSCWIDTSLETLFWTFNYDWTNIVSLFDQSPGHPFYHIYLNLKLRRTLLLGNPTDSKAVEKQLTGFRESARSYIKFNKFGYNNQLYDYDAITSWISTMIDISHSLTSKSKDEISETDRIVSNYFAMEVVTLKRCTGDPNKTITRTTSCAHIQLTPPHPGPNPRTTGGPFPSDWDAVQGNLQNWIRNLTNISSSKSKPVRQCWWTSDNQCFCQGNAEVLEFCTSLPLCWIVSQHTDEKPWNYPRRLFPLPGKEAMHQHCIYEMTARIFFNGSHYVARYIVPTDTGTHQSAVYFYDGNCHDGYAQKETGSLEKLLSGVSPTLPSSHNNAQYKTCAVVYRLKGGRPAQEWFMDRQVALLEKEAHISIIPHPNSIAKLLSASTTFTHTDFPVKPSSQCHWLTDKKIEQYKNQASSPTEYQNITQKTIVTMIPKLPATISISSSDSLSARAPNNTTSASHASSNSDMWSLLRAVKKIEHNHGYSGLSSAELSSIVNQLIGEDKDSLLLSSSSSPPSSPIQILCRCGADSDGDHQECKEEAIQCTVCKDKWSHIACQTYRTTGATISKFKCPNCAIPFPANPQHIRNTIIKLRRSTRIVQDSKASTSVNLFPGKGVLAKDGVFYYPARLIFHDSRAKTWTVRFWRLNQLATDCTQKPNSDCIVPENHIVDELWLNQTARRRIRLGRWTRAYEVDSSEEEFLFDPESLPYNTEIEKALHGHKKILAQIMNDPDSVDGLNAPVMQWFRQANRHTRAVEYSGGLSQDDCARINNWFLHKIDGARDKIHIWGASLPIAHARTLLLAHRHHHEFQESIDRPPESDSDRVPQKQFILHKCFERLVDWTGKMRDGKAKHFHSFDVDLEALRVLEVLIFDISKDAGIAGNHQWGLDVGSHQDNWDPWVGDGPEHNASNIREASDTELERGPNFKDDQVFHIAYREPLGSRPQPRPKYKSGAQATTRNKRRNSSNDIETGRTKRSKS